MLFYRKCLCNCPNTSFVICSLERARYSPLENKANTTFIVRQNNYEIINIHKDVIESGPFKRQLIEKINIS